MEIDPREWGPVAQVAALLWWLSQLPRIAEFDTGAGFLGGLFGATFGVIVFGGVIRAVLVGGADKVRSDNNES